MNSVLRTVLGTALSLICSTMLAYTLSRTDFIARKLFHYSDYNDVCGRRVDPGIYSDGGPEDDQQLLDIYISHADLGLEHLHT